MKRIACVLLAALGMSLGAVAFGDTGYDTALKAYSCVDYEKALRIFKEEAAKGHGLSQYMVGNMMDAGQATIEDPAAALNWYMMAAKQGVSDAYYALGDSYDRGRGVAKDLVQAYAWYDLAKIGGVKLASDKLKAVIEQMSAEQLNQAMQFVKDWQAKSPR